MGGFKSFVSGAALALMLAGCAGSYAESAPAASGPPAPAVRLVQPPARDQSELQVLFWNDAQRSERFRAMEQWFAGHEVPAAKSARALPKGSPLSPALKAEITALMQSTKTAGVMVLVDGKVLFEFVEPDGVTGTRKLSAGTFALQAHDPGSEVHYKNIRVKRLP